MLQVNVRGWLERQRAVIVEPDYSREVMRVRVQRADGTEIAREFTALALVSSRLHPVEMVSACFPDLLDRLAISLLGRPMLDAGHSALRHDRSYARARSGASEPSHSNCRCVTDEAQRSLAGSARAWQERVDQDAFLVPVPERAEEKPRGEPLAKRNPALPVYRPR